MKDANTARLEWLMARNNDLVPECEAQIEKMLEKKLPKAPSEVGTDNFVLDFTHSLEVQVLRLYLEKLGYYVIFNNITPENYKAGEYQYEIQIFISYS